MNTRVASIVSSSFVTIRGPLFDAVLISAKPDLWTLSGWERLHEATFARVRAVAQSWILISADVADAEREHAVMVTALAAKRMSLQQQRIAELCEQLKLARLATDWPALAQDAARDDGSFADFLEKVLASEVTARDERRIAMMTKLATMHPPTAPLSGFLLYRREAGPSMQTNRKGQDREAHRGVAKTGLSTRSTS